MGRWMRPRDRAASSAPGCGRRGGGERGNRGRATASVFFRRAGGGAGDRVRGSGTTHGGNGERGTRAGGGPHPDVCPLCDRDVRDAGRWRGAV